MILHASILADDPRQTATTIAKLFGGRALPFGPGNGSWTAVGPDPIGNVVSVMPRGTEFHRRFGEEVETREATQVRHSGFHLMIETPLSEADVMDLAREADCFAQRAKHGPFEVIEFWIDDCMLIEVATPDLATEYRRLVVSDELRQRLAAVVAGNAEAA